MNTFIKSKSSHDNVLDEHILKGVGKKLRVAYMTSQVSEKEVMIMYNRNKKEADAFDLFGLSISDLMREEVRTHNPLLREKLGIAIDLYKAKSRCSSEQNALSLAKLQFYRDSALGMGIRPVMDSLRRLSAKGDQEASICLTLLEIEFANLSAKRLNQKKTVIYQRKDILLADISYMLSECGWRCGVSANTGKNASYIVYVYLPDGTQLSWHCNNYRMVYYYEEIECEWDGRPCSTLEKLFTYVYNRFGIGTPLVMYASSEAA